jgi:hypothetical protein
VATQGPVAQMVLRRWSVSDLDETTGRLQVVARLDEAPPDELADCFGRDYDGAAWPDDLEAPTLDGALVSFEVRPEDVVRYRDALRERLAAASRRYAEVVVPLALALEAAIRAKEEERLRIIAEAQRLFDLDPELERTPASEPVFERRAEPQAPGLSVGLASRVAERGRRAAVS